MRINLLEFALENVTLSELKISLSGLRATCTHYVEANKCCTVFFFRFEGLLDCLKCMSELV